MLNASINANNILRNTIKRKDAQLTATTKAKDAKYNAMVDAKDETFNEMVDAKDQQIKNLTKQIETYKENEQSSSDSVIWQSMAITLIVVVFCGGALVFYIRSRQK